ncbi:hypothetical protein GLYMA_07G027850v4 [Glycine max]|nr:hypothetical protein GLYMA_07G027850v4 [Glycine max]KAH1085081.1 hypothetical protein GYH30_017220 [Glycine max]
MKMLIQQLLLLLLKGQKGSLSNALSLPWLSALA